MNAAMTKTEKRGRKTARPEGEQLVSIRLPVETYRVVKAIVGLRSDKSINDIANRLFAGWVAEEEKIDPLVKAVHENIIKELDDAKKAAEEALKKPSKRRALKT